MVIHTICMFINANLIYVLRSRLSKFQESQPRRQTQVADIDMVEAINSVRF
jgi:hypothetical protein